MLVKELWSRTLYEEFHEVKCAGRLEKRKERAVEKKKKENRKEERRVPEEDPLSTPLVLPLVFKQMEPDIYETWNTTCRI